MIVKVLEICNELLRTVLCETSYGTVTLDWHGDTIPQAGETWNVELETAHVFCWESDIAETNAPISLQDKDSCIELVGDVDSVNEDGYTVLRMGNCIVSVLTRGTPLCPGTRVAFTVEHLGAYPTDKGEFIC